MFSDVILIPKRTMIPMPWKNGLGLTTQIAIQPPDAKFPEDEFLWRMSCAEVRASNQFSNFSGYNRLLVVWKGEGLVLNGMSLKPFLVHQFSGEEKIQCELINGPVIDFGLIYKRDRVDAALTIHRVEQSPFLLPSSVGTRLIFCASGECSIDQVEVNQGDAVQLNSGNEKRVTTNSAATLLSVSILAL